MSESATNSWQRKIRSKLGHLLNRIELIQPLDAKDEELKAQLLTSTLELILQFTKKVEALSVSTDNIPVDVVFEQQSLSQKLCSTPKTSTSFNNTSIQQSPTSQPTCSTAQVANILENLSLLDPKLGIKDFKVNFSGKNDSLSFNAFSENIREMAESRGVTDDQLFRRAFELFEGEALIYYRSIKSQANSWSDLMRLFREEYFRDGDRKIFEQIKARTQGEQESIAIYVAKMQRLFGFLSFSVSESMKLEMIKTRIRPEYQISFGLIEDIDSISKLGTLGRKFEDTKRSISNFVAPRFNENAVEFDLEYHSQKKVDNSIINKHVKFSDESSVLSGRSLSSEPEISYLQSNTRKSRSISRSNSRNRHTSKSKSNSRDRFSHHCCSSLDSRRNFDTNYEHQSLNYSRSPYRAHTVGSPINSRERSVSGDRTGLNSHSHEYDTNRFSNNPSTLRNQLLGNQSQMNQTNKARQYPLNPKAKDFTNNYTGRKRSRDVDVVCFRCNGLNHYARNCTSSIIKCFSCGLVGFTKRNCPKCSLN